MAAREPSPPPAASADPSEAPPAADERYRKEERLQKRADYVRVQTRGKKHGSRLLTIVWMPSPAERTRIGITVSRKVGNAPVRNALKRRIREVYRLHKAWWPAGMDFVVIARPRAKGASYAELRRAMLKWARTLGPTPDDSDASAVPDAAEKAGDLA